MREIILDTETTGLDPYDGHRIVEIGCLELVDRVWTGRTYQQYINPERAMTDDAYRVHGISDEDLADKPKFHEIAEDFLGFVDGAPIVAHNASFDMKFLNWELTNIGREPLPMENVVDTLAIARKRFPGAANSLDALCRRFEVDNTDRTLHGALIDSKLLADVYYHLVGVRQAGLTFGGGDNGGAGGPARRYREPRPHAPAEAELAAHGAFLESYVSEPIWLKN